MSTFEIANHDLNILPFLPFVCLKLSVCVYRIDPAFCFAGSVRISCLIMAGAAPAADLHVADEEWQKVATEKNDADKKAHAAQAVDIAASSQAATPTLREPSPPPPPPPVPPLSPREWKPPPPSPRGVVYTPLPPPPPVDMAVTDLPEVTEVIHVYMYESSGVEWTASLSLKETRKSRTCSFHTKNHCSDYHGSWELAANCAELTARFNYRWELAACPSTLHPTVLYRMLDKDGNATWEGLDDKMHTIVLKHVKSVARHGRHWKLTAEL